MWYGLQFLSDRCTQKFTQEGVYIFDDYPITGGSVTSAISSTIAGGTSLALGLWSIGQGSRQVGPLPKGDRVDGRRPARILWACLWLVHLTGSNLFVTIPPNRQYIVIMTNYMKFREGDTTIRQVPPAGTNRIYYLIKSIYWPNRDRHLTDRHELCAERWQGMRGIIKNGPKRAKK